MAEANIPHTGSSIENPTPDEFSRLDKFHQREAYKRLYGQHMLCNAEAKCNHTEQFEAVRSQKEGDLDTSSAVDQTMVDRQSANAYETLVKSLTAKDVRNAELETMVNASSRYVKNIGEMLKNSTEKNTEMQKMLKEKEEELSASKAKCSELTRQVDNLNIELKDREDRIHTITESARRDQEQNAELSAQLDVLRTDREQAEAEAEVEQLLANVFQENARLRAQLEEEMRRNQILRNLLQMIARRSLERRLPNTEVSTEMLE